MDDSDNDNAGAYAIQNLIQTSLLEEKNNHNLPWKRLYGMCLGGGRSKGGVGIECDERGRGGVVLQTHLSLIAQVVIT